MWNDAEDAKPKVCGLKKLALGFPTDGADGRLTHIVAKIIGDCRAHARNRNPDYRRHRCDLVLGHR